MLCHAKTEGLVRYPTVLAPSSGRQNILTQCADNAHKASTSLFLFAMCTSSGTWSGTPQCECDSGYHTVTVHMRQICQGRPLEI